MSGVPKKRTIALMLVSALIGSAMIGVGACGGRSEPVEMKLLVLGIDGMDWRLADPLMVEGKLPNVERITKGGVKVELRSMAPILKSPIIWTTIATGKGPTKHGIGDYTARGGEKLVGSESWRARPVWDILGEKGHTVGVVNWMISWPAFEVNGYSVSDRFVFAPEDGYDNVARATYPEELAEELAHCRQPASEVTDDEIAFLLNGDFWRTTDDVDVRGGVASVKELYSVDETVREVAKYLLETKEQPDFFAVYVNGLDRYCHRFWGQMDPSSVDLFMSDDFIYVFKDAILGYYTRVDVIVGEILDRVDDDTTVILCSDHGFRGPYRTREGTKLGIWMHRNMGVLAAKGPGIGGGESLTDASVLDLTPTFLSLFGLPVARDMDGYVVTEMLDESFLDRHPLAFIDTYETGEEAPAREPMTSPVDDAIKERLRSLGYIE